MPIGALSGDGPAGAGRGPARPRDALRYRDFLTVALVVPEESAFPDNWIYVHAPDVEVGRIQNFGSWSPYMVKDGPHLPRASSTSCTRATSCGRSPTPTSSSWATRELAAARPGPSRARVEAGYVVRMPKAYPVYDEDYKANVDVLRDWLAAHAPNVHPVGRNGMHRYNNQDHSMYTAMLAVENIFGRRPRRLVGERRGGVPRGELGRSAGTGRDAPVLPPVRHDRAAARG